MPQNGFSLGKDLTFTLVGPNGNITLSGVTDYTIKPMFTKLKHKDISGIVQNAAIPDGWDITIRLERRDNTLDVFFAALEAAYFAGSDISNGTISENIQEEDGSISKFQYTNVSLVYDDAGSWKSDAFIAVSIGGSASRRIRLS